MFGAQASTPAFGTPSTPPFSSSSLFGTPSSTPAFSTPAFGTPSTSSFATGFGTPSTPSFATGFGTPSTPSFATGFGTPSTPSFATGFGTPSTSSFATGFGTPSPSPFATGFGFSSQFSPSFATPTQPQQPNQPFQPQTGFGFQTTSQFPSAAAPVNPFSNVQFPSATPPATPFPNAQPTTLMAPVSPLSFSLADRDIQAIVDAYKDDPGNPKYAFKSLLFSVTEPHFKVKPNNISDIMWAEAMGKLEGMEAEDRERLWPQIVNGFKDLSQRLKLQDEVIISDSERLKTTQSNVKKLQWHIQSDTTPRIQKLKQTELSLQRRLLRVMRILEALENKGFRMPLTKEEGELAEKLGSIARQVRGCGGELSRRVQNVLALSRAKCNRIGSSDSLYIPGSSKIDERSLSDMLEVLQQQTLAISRLANVLKRDIRDWEIMSKDNAIN